MWWVHTHILVHTHLPTLSQVGFPDWCVCEFVFRPVLLCFHVIGLLHAEIVPVCHAYLWTILRVCMDTHTAVSPDTDTVSCFAWKTGKLFPQFRSLLNRDTISPALRLSRSLTHFSGRIVRSRNAQRRHLKLQGHGELLRPSWCSLRLLKEFF